MSGLNEQFLGVIYKKFASLAKANKFLKDITFKEMIDVQGTINASGAVKFPSAGEHTISGGVITIAGGSNFTVDTESDAASDDLDTINGLADGQEITIRPENGGRTVVIKHGTGNIHTFDGGDITLDETRKQVTGRYDETLDKVLFSASGVTLLDEDDMVSDSASQGATQQSIKAYVDAQASGYSLIGTAIASAGSSMDITGDWSDYDVLVLHWSVTSISAAHVPKLRISDDSGSTWESGANTYDGVYFGYDSASVIQADASGNALNMGPTVGSGAVGLGGTVVLHRPSQTSYNKPLEFSTT